MVELISHDRCIGPDYMLIDFIETLLINIFNSLRRWRRKPASPPPAPTHEVPPGYTVLGRVIDEPAIDGEAVARRLQDEGIVAISPIDRRRHLYTLGATGCGKTNLLLRLIESDITHSRAFCVIDLRGDLVERILLRLADAAPASGWAKRLLLVDLRDETSAVGFNPLAGEGDVYQRALHLLDVIKSQSDSWGIQLEETLRNCLLALAETGWSMLEIEPLLENPAFRQQVLQQVTDPRVKAFFERFNQMSEQNRLSWTLAVLNKVTPLLSLPQLRMLFGQRRSIPFQELFDTQPGMIMLVSLAVDKLQAAARLTGGLFISSFQGAFMARADQPEGQRVPTFLYVDEFETMATDTFETIVAEGRRFGLGLCLSHQNLRQLSPGLRDVLRNNVHTQVYFQTGAVDAAELAKEISTDEKRDTVRTTLIDQGVGEAYLVRRGQPSVRIRTIHTPDPQVTAGKVAAVRAVAAENYATRRSDIEAELGEREAMLRSLSGKAPADEKPTYEIRHEKTRRFKPKDAE